MDPISSEAIDELASNAIRSQEAMQLAMHIYGSDSICMSVVKKITEPGPFVHAFMIGFEAGRQASRQRSAPSSN